MQCTIVQVENQVSLSTNLLVRISNNYEFEIEITPILTWSIFSDAWSCTRLEGEVVKSSWNCISLLQKWYWREKNEQNGLNSCLFWFLRDTISSLCWIVLTLFRRFYWSKKKIRAKRVKSFCHAVTLSKFGRDVRPVFEVSRRIFLEKIPNIWIKIDLRF